MSRVSSLRYTFNGFFWGHGIIYQHASANNVQQDQTDLMAWKQSARIDRIITFALFVRDAANDIVYSSSLKKRLIVKALAAPIPFALQIINHHVDDKNHPQIKKGVIFARNNLEQLAVVIDTLVTGYFAIMISPFFGAGILTGIVFQIGLSSHKLPAKVKIIWERSLPAIVFANMLSAHFLYGEMRITSLIFNLIDLSLFIWQRFFEDRKFQNLATEKRMTLEEAKSILKTKASELEVDLKHLGIRVGFQNSGAVNIISSMENLANRVEWNTNNLKVLKKKLFNDPHFQNEYPDIHKAENINDEKAKELFYKETSTFAKEIAQKEIAQGDSYIRYDILQQQLRTILDLLEKSQEDISDDLFKLAIDGGLYCASGKVRAIQDLYEEKIAIKGNMQMKLLLWLYWIRRRWFETVFVYLSKYANKLPRGIINPNDQHFYNLALFYFDRPFKLHDETLKNDMSLAETGLCNRIYQLVLSLISDIFFWRCFAVKSPNWYSAEAIIEAIEEESTHSSKSGGAEQKWWQDWINQLPESEDKEDLDNDLPMFKIFDRSIYDNTARRQALNKDIIKLMLFDMGILKKPGS